MRTVDVFARIAGDLTEPERHVEVARSVEVAARDRDKRDRRRRPLDQLDGGAVRVAHHDEPYFAAAVERMRERLAPYGSVERANTVDRGVEVGNADAEPLETRLGNPGRGSARRSRLVPLE